MMKGKLQRLLHSAQLAAAMVAMAGCGAGGMLERPMPRYANAGAAGATRLAALPDRYTGIISTTMIELQHLDAYEYYRSVRDLHAVPANSGSGTSGVVSASVSGAAAGVRGGSNSGINSGTNADSNTGYDADFLSCFRTRAFK